LVPVKIVSPGRGAREHLRRPDRH